MAVLGKSWHTYGVNTLPEAPGPAPAARLPVHAPTPATAAVPEGVVDGGDLVVVLRALRTRLRLPLLLLALEVRPGHPSAPHRQCASRCVRFMVRGALVLSPSRRPCSLLLLPCSHRSGPRPLHPASNRPGLGVGPGRPGAVPQRLGADAAGQHRVDRRLECLLPHHPTCRHPLFCPTPTPLLSFFHHSW